jgi:hypothetical protein
MSSSRRTLGTFVVRDRRRFAQRIVCTLQAPQARRRAGERLFGEIHRLSVPGLEEKPPDRLRIVPVENLVERLEVAERFRHLLSIELQQAAVHPDVRHRRRDERLGLCDLVLVVGEDQVVPAAVNVKRFAEQCVAHRGALDVPTRPAFAPRRRPRGFAGLGEFPHREVQRIALLLAGRDPRADQQLARVSAGKRAVTRERGDREIHAVPDDVGVIPLDQRFDHRENFRDILGRARLAIGVENVQAVHRPLETREIFVDDDVPRHAAFSPFRNAAVVDVGYVAHEVDPVPKMDEIAAQDVEEHERAGVAEMRFGGWSQTAHVNAYGVPRERSERFDRPRARII